MSSTKLPAGTWVLVQGLVSRPEYNDRRALVLSFDDRGGRYTVALEDGKELKLKPECMVPTEPPKAGSVGAAMSSWQEEEEARVRASPAPPLWDECEAEFQGRSFVFDPQFQGFLKAFVEEGVRPCCAILEPADLPADLGIQMPTFSLVHLACMSGDLPALRAYGRFNADFNSTVYSDKGLCPLAVAVVASRGLHPNLPGSEALRGFRCVEWLLQRGVDPNVQDQFHLSPLDHALSSTWCVTSDSNIEVDLCKLLLLHGANPSVLKKCKDAAKRKMLESYAKQIKDEGTARPPTLCPCGNNVPVKQCHGAAHGVPVHPRSPCLCKKPGRTYEKCCFKRRHYLRESLDQIIPPPRIINDPGFLELMRDQYERVQNEGRKAGLTDEQIRTSPVFPQAAKTDPKEMQKAQQEMLLQLFSSVNDPRIDPCFLYCIQHPTNDFQYARSWKRNGIMMFSKFEGIKRRDEWNAMVDDYIASHQGTKDTRPRFEIMRLNKICHDGTALWKWCANHACSNREEELSAGTYKACAKCCMSFYCSRECQAAAWKAGHKGTCGQVRNEQMLPSQVAADEMMNGMLKMTPILNHAIGRAGILL
jgi:hypothetical protein